MLLITGGSGYLGGELLRRAPGSVGTAHTGAGDVRLDVRDAAAVERVMQAVRPDTVIHTAYARRGEGAWETNVTGARNVALAGVTAAPRGPECGDRPDWQAASRDRLTSGTRRWRMMGSSMTTDLGWSWR